jgi:hypothetical protein
MDYPVLNTTAVAKMISDIGQLNHDLAGKTNDTERAKVTAQIQSTGIKLEERLNKDIRILKGYFTTHQDKATRWLAQSQVELKDATNLAAAFKKDPKKTELMPQLKRAIDGIDLIQQTANQDFQEYGQAIVPYRALGSTAETKKYFTTFSEIRGRMIDDEMANMVKKRQIDNLRKQADALLDVTAKASMKADIKKTGAAQRPIGDAQAAAKALVSELDHDLVELNTPPGMLPKPSTIRAQGILIFTGLAANKNLVKGDKDSVDKTWKNVDGAYQTAAARLATMKKVAATRTKGFRSNELSDPVVKAELAKAQDRIKTADTAFKQYDKDYAAAKKLYGQLITRLKNVK